MNRQTGGRGSFNFQGDEIRVQLVQSDLTAGQVMDLVLQIGRANLLEMQGEARRIVDERLEEFTNQFVTTAQQGGSATIGAVSDPDIQYSLFTAQRDFARSGERRLGDTLVDLLVTRCGERTGSIRALALNAAIETVGRLTPAQINALSCFWLVTRVKNLALNNLDDLGMWIRRNLEPLSTQLPSHESSYEHLTYAGCAQIQVVDVPFGRAWRNHYPGLFSRGMTEAEIPDHLRDIPGIFIPCLNDPQRLQIRALDAEVAATRAMEAGHPELADDVSKLLGENVYPEDKVEEIVLGIAPDLAPFATNWRTSAISRLRLSSVGTVLAHANWHRQVGPETDLDVWIPDET